MSGVFTVRLMVTLLILSVSGSCCLIVLQLAHYRTLLLHYCVILFAWLCFRISSLLRFFFICYFYLLFYFYFFIYIYFYCLFFSYFYRGSLCSVFLCKYCDMCWAVRKKVHHHHHRLFQTLSSFLALKPPWLWNRGVKRWHLCWCQFWYWN